MAPPAGFSTEFNGQMGLAHPGRADNHQVGFAGQELAMSQIQNLPLVQLRHIREAIL
jgi:hypothetical protein